MRKLEFRAWDIELKRYCFFNLINGVVEWINNELHSFDKNRLDQEQYTGIKDRDGVKIFEGDIISVSYFDDLSDAQICEIRWGGDYPAFDAFLLDKTCFNNTPCDDCNTLSHPNFTFKVISTIREYKRGN